LPHAVITGNLEPGEVFRRLGKISERSGTAVLKTGASYLEKDGRAILIEATAVEAGRPLGFLVLVGQRDDGLVVRLHPSQDVEKTEAVKKLLALIARAIIAQNPGSSLGKTNLAEYL